MTNQKNSHPIFSPHNDKLSNSHVLASSINNHNYLNKYFKYHKLNRHSKSLYINHASFQTKQRKKQNPWTTYSIEIWLNFSRKAEKLIDNVEWSVSNCNFNVNISSFFLCGFQDVFKTCDKWKIVTCLMENWGYLESNLFLTEILSHKLSPRHINKKKGKESQ
jgi:hypothetical protein